MNFQSDKQQAQLNFATTRVADSPSQGNSIRTSLEGITMSSSPPSSASTTAATTPSSGPNAPATGREAAAASVAAPPTPATKHLTTTMATMASTAGAHRHQTSPLEREHVPSRVGLPIEELLARRCLPSSPYESYQRGLINGSTMRSLRAVGASGQASWDFEAVKEELRAAGAKMGWTNPPAQKE